MEFKNPEEEIQYLEKKILERRAELKELEIKSVVRKTLEEHVGAEISTPPAPRSQAPAVNLPKPTDLDKTVALYIQFAFGNGIREAVKKVRDTHNPYLIDAFHDALIDKFLEQLREKGLLEHG